MPRYIGLDVHKNYIHACEFFPGQPEGKQERHFRFPNTSQGWSAFIGQLDPDTRVALEVTGSAFEIYDTLFPHAGQVFVANALELKRMGSGRHTDRADASRLARMLAIGTLPTVWVPPQTMRQVRRLLRARERLNRSRLALINQARSVLSRHGVTVPKGADLFRLLTPHDLVRLPTGEKAIVLANLEGARSLSQQVDALTVEIAQSVAHIPEVKQLLTIPGVGIVTAAALWARLGDPQRFRSPKQVARYVGIDPSVDQSGERDRRGRISRRGDTLLRYMLVEAAWSTARYDTGALGAFYRRKVKTLGARRAIVALARKLLIVAWRILLTGEPYRAQKADAVKRKEGELRRLLRRAVDWEAIGAEMWPSSHSAVSDPPSRESPYVTAG